MVKIQRGMSHETFTRSEGHRREYTCKSGHPVQHYKSASEQEILVKNKVQRYGLCSDSAEGLAYILLFWTEEIH